MRKKKYELELREMVSPQEIHIYGFVSINGEYHNVGVSECSLMPLTIPDSGIERECFYFNRFFVKPEYRKNGYGRQMITKMMEYVREIGIPICCEVSPYGKMSYRQLTKFYKSFGFEVYKVKFGYKYFKQLWII